MRAAFDTLLQLYRNQHQSAPQPAKMQAAALAAERSSPAAQVGEAVLGSLPRTAPARAHGRSLHQINSGVDALGAKESFAVVLVGADRCADMRGIRVDEALMGGADAGAAEGTCCPRGGVSRGARLLSAESRLHCFVVIADLDGGLRRSALSPSARSHFAVGGRR
eukprot:6200483-Pleurochrysis_carterae.AAC.1